MKVLVTGGDGFLGKYVVDLLLRVGHEVYIFDIKEKASNFEHYIQGDLLCQDSVFSAVSKVEAICHLGAVGDVYQAFDNPAYAALLNVVGTANVLQAAFFHKVQKVVYASTWEVYGYPKYQPIDEKHPCSPDHPYSITKLAGEQLLLSYDTLKGVPAVALRLGTAYGLNMRPNSVFSIFIEQALKGFPITIHGDGMQARQFTHASDIAQAFVKALESEDHQAVYNIVADQNISIRELAEMIVRELPTDIIFKGSRLGDVHSAIISNEKARKRLGWSNEVSFQDGLRELISHRYSVLRSNTETLT